MVRIISSQPRKQRKARYNAPHHMRGSLLHASLSKDLQGRYKRRSIRVIKGDTVKVLRGDHTGTEGKVDNVNTKSLKIVVDGVSVKKADGSEVPRPIDPSNVVITDLNLEDKRREQKLSGE
ncbi:50S ribosomal protein L24 [Methanospirillum sp.]|uniref:50S ribosomal protein L24 n=1 Tax=Methanospirillum sp. TaxID=45200 RepID=UPI0029878B52|nr:50S ribosomal protein L24 [Methanospirillum sp.]